MRNLLALVAALVIVFLGLGWYLDWYRISSTTTEDGHRHISIDVDSNRIKTDVGNKVRDLFDGKDSPAAPPTPKTTPGITTGFQREDGSFVYPETFVPVPPGGGPKLPPPR